MAFGEERVAIDKVNRNIKNFFLRKGTRKTQIIQHHPHFLIGGLQYEFDF